MNSGDDPGQCEEIVEDVEGEEPQPGPVPAVAELEQRELREEEEGPASPADCEGHHGARLAILVLPGTEVEAGEEVSQGPEAVPQQDGQHLQHPAEQAVHHPAGVGVAGLGGEVGLC